MTLYPQGGPGQAMGATKEHLDAAPNAARLIVAIHEDKWIDEEAAWAAWSDAWDHVIAGEDMTAEEVSVWLRKCGLEG